MSGPVQAKPTNDLFINLALGALVAAVAFTGLLRIAGSVTAFLTGLPEPAGGFTSGLAVLVHPTDPGAALGAEGLNPILYWVVVFVFLGALGTATAGEVTQVASAKALVKKSATLRPSLTEKPRPEEVGYLLGMAKGRQVWATVEDSILLIGPPRSGKDLHVVINAILDAPGAVITTNTRPDNLTATMKARERTGPVAVFDPQQLAPGLPSGMRWGSRRGLLRRENHRRNPRPPPRGGPRRTGRSISLLPVRIPASAQSAGSRSSHPTRCGLSRSAPVS